MDQTNIVQGQKLVQCRKGNGTRGENSLQFRKLDQKCTKVLWACVKILKKKRASAGNRTRIDCLEGNHANLYTTDATFNYDENELFPSILHCHLT